MKNRRQLTYHGLVIKNRLMQLNMTQTELAGKINVSVGYLTDILRGRRSGGKYMDKIYSLLGLEETELKKASGG